jgi:uncharacterized 2Fe-2S/4Fe-4S cluster protein (DUF4445 family)
MFLAAFVPGGAILEDMITGKLGRFGRPDKEEGWIRCIPLRLTPPSLKDNTADADRLIKGLEKVLQGQPVKVGLRAAKRIPHLLREYGYAVHSVLYLEEGAWNLIDIQPASKEPQVYGLAVDLGTTTLVLRLVNLMNGQILGEVSFRNPQTEIGLDILTRIHFAGLEGGLSKLQVLVIETLNNEIESLAKRNNLPSDALMGIAVAGNTTMTHLFLGLDPYWICREPYIPAINKIPLFKASELGIRIHPDAPALVFPNVGSYFGGDLIAGILASGMACQESLSILVDIGTNAEIVLGNKDWLMACAGAAGPALEGGVASIGMMAGPGVIDKVTIDRGSGDFLVRTMGNRPAVGICGSGLIDLVAQLFLARMIDIQGKFIPENCGKRLKDLQGIKSYVLVPAQESATGEDLALSQTDIDALLRSKAAMFTILTTITGMANVSMSDFKDFFIAGTFGAYVNPESAITIGMVPDLPRKAYKPLGNTSLSGATMALLSSRASDEIQSIRNRVTYIELNVNQEFMNLFSAAKFIPHTDLSLFPSVRARARERYHIP